MDQAQHRDIWAEFESVLVPLLGGEDDLELWATVVAEVYEDAEYLCRYNPSRRWIETEIGAGSHWLRPHQTRWTADGGFAYPVGYEGGRFSTWSLP
ncbi:MAG: hypothetical protein LJF06_06575, partial [Gemmatimonadetes bacterium]|nr:hypothetical protein [Gemmatimonadota bacterium]